MHSIQIDMDAEDGCMHKDSCCQQLEKHTHRDILLGVQSGQVSERKMIHVFVYFLLLILPILRRHKVPKSQ